MKKIVDYCILKHKNPDLLEIAVKEYIKLGWQPKGGLCWLMDNSASQAMIKYEPPTKMQSTGPR
jgi:hypothetical protein